MTKNFLRRPYLNAVAGFAALICVAGHAAAESPTIVRVEEDWELKVTTPDQNSTAPQVSCVMSPTGSFHCFSSVFEINHRSQPSFTAGGLQLQVWSGDIPLEARSSPCDCTMASQNETVSWTKSMTLHEGSLVFEIHNGTSATWGTFGDQGNLKTTTSTHLKDLNAYDPEFSAANSGVGYAANRVQTLLLKAVRLITETGDVLEDTSVRTVHSHN